MSQLKRVYDYQYLSGRYSHSAKATLEEHSARDNVLRFVNQNELARKLCLEVGCGLGAFQDVIENYVGIDLSEVAGRYLRKPFVCASATQLPFRDASFDAAWSIATLEHIPYPEPFLEDLRRVLKPGARLLLLPAWHVRSWASKGLGVRPYSDLSWTQRLAKSIVPVRNSLFWRALPTMIWRMFRLLRHLLVRGHTRLSYHSLEPDYEHNWSSDADAAISLDPFEVILWFVSRGDRCLNYPTILRAFLCRTGELIIETSK